MKKTEEKSGLREQLQNLSDREKMMLKIMAGVFAVLGLVLIIGLSQRAIGELEAETRTYANALSQLADRGPAYLEAQQGGDVDPRVARFPDEALDSGRIQLTGFVATHAAATNVAVTSYNEQQNAIGNEGRRDSGPRIIERSLQVDIRSAQLDRLVEFLQRIEESPDAVIIRRIRMNAGRNEDGEVRQVQVVISTFERRSGEET